MADRDRQADGPYSLHNWYFVRAIETSDHESREKKIERNTTPCQTQNTIHPAKRGVKRVEIELAMLDFRTDHCQLIACA